MAATVDFHEKVYCLCTICSIVDPPNVVKPHNSSYLMAGFIIFKQGFTLLKTPFILVAGKEKWKSLALCAEQYVWKATRAL